MQEAIGASLDWLITQHVPLLWFLIALLTNPTEWSKRATGFLKQRLGSSTNG